MNVSVIAEVKNNRPQLSEYQRTKINKAFAIGNGKVMQITVSDIKKERSNNQNAYYWGVLIRILSDETGQEADDLHEHFRDRFLTKNFIHIGGEEKEVAKSTKKLSTNEFEEYQEKIRAFAAEELSIIIPLPNEQL
jgi:hypothetical protein